MFHKYKFHTHLLYMHSADKSMVVTSHITDCFRICHKYVSKNNIYNIYCHYFFNIVLISNNVCRRKYVTTATTLLQIMTKKPLICTTFPHFVFVKFVQALYLDHLNQIIRHEWRIRICLFADRVSS